MLLLILAALVAADAYREESTLLWAQMEGLIPDVELIERLENVRVESVRYSEEHVEAANDRLRTAIKDSSGALKDRIAIVQKEIDAKKSQRRSGTRRAIALLTGDVEKLKADIQSEIDISFLTAERDALRNIEDIREVIERRRRRDEKAGARAKWEWIRKCADFQEAEQALRRVEDEQGWRIFVPGSEAKRVYQDLSGSYEILGRQCQAAKADYDQAIKRLKTIIDSDPIEAVLIESADLVALEPLEHLIATKRAALKSAKVQAQTVQDSIRNVFGQALLILIGVTLAPIVIKAFWYWIVAWAAERQPPIRLRPRASGSNNELEDSSHTALTRQKASAVSQEVMLGPEEELLVHPDFLQSASDRNWKDTKWLLNARYPLTSLAARLVALTRVRGGTTESSVVSSRKDPFAEVGMIELSEGEAVVLQPRNLVGVVQRVERPIRIERQWQFRLSAWITFQFRYLIFEGPGTLIVQGCRGVRTETSGSGRSIDQAATIGFSANLDYSHKRSEPFAAYLMGENSLFCDNFRGGSGFFVYEEMPYAGRKAGITGRGLEGLTDGILKVFGI